MKKNRIMLRLTATLVILLLTSLTACGGQKIVTEQEKITVTRGDIVQSVNADGALSLSQDQKLSFGTSGKIDQINVSEGDRVTKSQVLAKLETVTLDRTVKTAELAIKSAEIDLKQAEHTVSAAEVDLEQAKYAVTAAEIDLEQARDNYRKITYPYTYSTFTFDVPQALDSVSNAERQIREAQKALQTELTTAQYYEISRQLRQALDNLVVARERLGRGMGADVFQSQILPIRDFWTLRAAQLQMEKAESAVDNAKNTVNKAKLAVDNAKNTVNRAKLAVDRARYDWDTAKENLDQAVITSPFNGIIARANTKVGDVLTPQDYSKTILEIIDPGRVELKIDVDEIDIPGVKLGQEATIKIDALPNDKLSGKVIFISPRSKTEAGVVLYEVKIGLDVPRGLELKGGMSASADIITAQQTNVLLVPNRALTQDSSGKSTVKLLVNGQIEERTVVTGISDSFYTEIVSGLHEGDTVVIERQVKTISPGFFG